MKDAVDPASEALKAPRTVRDVMTTDMISLKVGDTLRLADDLMLLGELRNFPVLDGARVVGVINQADLLSASMHSLVHRSKDSVREALGAVVVRDVMKAPILITPEASLAEAARVMADKGLECLVVMECEKPVGLVTRTDMLREMAKQKELNYP
jgi:CBS-domain-containing membrane protein